MCRVRQWQACYQNSQHLGLLGTIPIISPMNGKAVGDLTVTGRFGEDVGELIKFT